jgi:hypothetical protein
MSLPAHEPSSDGASYTIWELETRRCVMTCYAGTRAFQLSIVEDGALVRQRWFTDTESATEFATQVLPAWARTAEADC